MYFMQYGFSLYDPQIPRPMMLGDSSTPHPDASHVNLYFLFKLRLQNPNR
jgi:hypothetical protein